MAIDEFHELYLSNRRQIDDEKAKPDALASEEHTLDPNTGEKSDTTETIIEDTIIKASELDPDGPIMKLLEGCDDFQKHPEFLEALLPLLRIHTFKSPKHLKSKGAEFHASIWILKGTICKGNFETMTVERTYTPADFDQIRQGSIFPDSNIFSNLVRPEGFNWFTRETGTIIAEVNYREVLAPLLRHQFPHIIVEYAVALLLGSTYAFLQYQEAEFVCHVLEFHVEGQARLAAAQELLKLIYYGPETTAAFRSHLQKENIFFTASLLADKPLLELLISHDTLWLMDWDNNYLWMKGATILANKGRFDLVEWLLNEASRPGEVAKYAKEQSLVEDCFKTLAEARLELNIKRKEWDRDQLLPEAYYELIDEDDENDESGSVSDIASVAEISAGIDWLGDDEVLEPPESEGTFIYADENYIPQLREKD